MALLARVAATMLSTPPEQAMMALPCILDLRSSTVSSMKSSAPSILNHLLGIGDDLVRLLLPVRDQRVPDGRVVHGYDLAGEDRRVVATVESDAGDRDARRHLDDREDRVQVQGPADGDADDGLDCERCYDSGEGRREARDGDEGVGVAALDELLYPGGGPVGGCHRDVEGDAQLLQDVDRLLRHGHVALATQDDGDL